MGLRDIGETLPPGFRFYPSDEELVCHYLYRKVCKKDDVTSCATLVDVDLHTCEPWQLPDVAKLNMNEWYFFSFRDRKYATGYRTNRATASGYWKATGKDRTVWDPRTRGIVGMRKTLVFYKNRAPNGIKTEWIMHEFRMENPNLRPKEDWVLCRVFKKSSRSVEDGHKTAQHVDDNMNNLYDPITTVAISPAALLSPFSDDHHAIINDNEHQLVSSFYSSSSQYHQLHHEPGQSTSLDLSKGNNISHCEPSSRDHRISDRNRLAESASCNNNDDFGFLFDMTFQCDNALDELGF